MTDSVESTPDVAADGSAASSLTIAVLAGGISHERDVSLRSGRRVVELLQRAGHRAYLREPDGTLLAADSTERPDVYWSTLHGASGEDGALQALLGLRGVAYIGTPPEGAALAWSKPTAKTLVRRAGHATPDWLALSRSTFRELGAANVMSDIVAGLGEAVVVKPAQGGSAQGLTIVEDSTDLPRALVDAYTYNDVALIERRVHGTELAISVVDTGEGPVALPPVEVEPLAGVYSFEARYNAGETVFYAPARLSDAILSRAADTAVAIHSLLGLRHLSRIDVIIDDEGTPWFLEANMLPGTTETSLLPLAVAAAGIDEGTLYADLARSAYTGAH